MADPKTLWERTARLIIDASPKINQFLKVQCSNILKIKTTELLTTFEILPSYRATKPASRTLPFGN